VVVDIRVVRIVLDSFLEGLKRPLGVTLFHVHTRDFDPRLSKRRNEFDGLEEVLLCTLHVIDQEPVGGK
jgi:hypothetical protein